MREISFQRETIRRCDNILPIIQAGLGICSFTHALLALSLKIAQFKEQL